jgi:hypothetical protein
MAFVNVIAQNATGAGFFDVQVTEDTGGVAVTTNYPATATTATTTTHFELSYVMTDGANTNLTVRISPTEDITDVTKTGKVYFVAQASTATNGSGIFDTYYESEEASLTVSANTNRQFVMSTGALDLSKRTRWSFLMSELETGVNRNQTLFSEVDSANINNNKVIFRLSTTNTLVFATTDGAGTTTTFTTPVQTFTPGADVRVEVDVQYVPTRVIIKVNGVVQLDDSSQTATAPVSLDYHFIAGGCNTLTGGACVAAQNPYSGVIRLFKVLQGS